MKIQTKHPHKASTFHVWVETTVERCITVKALDKKEAKELVMKRVTNRIKSMSRYKVLEHEVIDIEEVQVQPRNKN